MQPVTGIGIGNERQGTGAHVPPSLQASAVLIRPSRACIRVKVCCKRSALHLAHTRPHSPATSHFFLLNPQIKKKRVVTRACRHLSRLYVCTLYLLGRQCRSRHLTGRLCLVSSCLLLSLLLLLLLLLPVRRAAGGPARTTEDHRKRRGWNRLVGCWC